MVKQFAKDNNIDTAKLDQRPDIPRKRPRRLKLPGGEISSPCMPSIEVIKKERDELTAKGVLKLGEPVAPYSLTRFKTTNSGQLIKQTVTVEGRKIPMLDVRKQILSDQEQYMHLLTDEEIRSMPSEDLQFKLEQSLQPAIEIETTHTTQTNLAKIQRSRTLVCWHDHATILGTGYIMITINALYDTGVYMTEEEDRTKYGRLANNLQSIIERPDIY